MGKKLKEVNSTDQGLCLTIIRDFKKTMLAMATEAWLCMYIIILGTFH